MRVFLAARPPDAVIEELVSLQWGLTGARWTDPDQFHLTLRFVPHLGDVTSWVERLRGINWEPFEVQLRGVGHFPPRRQPRVAWVGVQPSDALGSLREAVERCAVAAGIPRDSRRYNPHVTVARMSEVDDAEMATFLASHGLFRSAAWSVDRLHLFRSRLGPGGAEYERLETIWAQGFA